MGTTLLKWKQPLAVIQANRKLSGSSLVIYYIVAAAFATLLMRDILNHDYFGCFVKIMIIYVMQVPQRVVPSYEIGDQGITYADGRGRKLPRWSGIEWYFFLPRNDVPEIMQVQFSIKKGRWWKAPPAFVFDPEEIDPDRLKNILEHYLPQGDLMLQERPR